jgi:hypothetical protein
MDDAEKKAKMTRQKRQYAHAPLTKAEKDWISTYKKIPQDPPIDILVDLSNEMRLFFKTAENKHIRILQILFESSAAENRRVAISLQEKAVKKLGSRTKGLARPSENVVVAQRTRRKQCTPLFLANTKKYADAISLYKTAQNSLKIKTIGCKIDQSVKSKFFDW